MKVSVIGVFGLMLILASCSKEINIVSQGELSDEPVLSTYLARFEREAALRGFNLNLADRNLTYSIIEIEEQNVAGYCQYHNNVATDIVIDKSFFEQASDSWREMVIFHELGHCVLYRGHEEATLNNGTCASIMRSGVQDCQDAYNSETRTYYLNELFTTSL